LLLAITITHISKGEYNFIYSRIRKKKERMAGSRNRGGREDRKGIEYDTFLCFLFVLLFGFPERGEL
jgi:hypothetical protein